MLKKRNHPYMIPRRSHWIHHVIAGLCAALLLFSVIYTCLPVHGEAAVYDAVIRLHVIANSDSEADQQNKLAVRDAVLTLASQATLGMTSREAARAALTQMLPTLEKAAQEVLRERGSEQPVRVVLGQEEYPTRTYDTFCFPAGEYLSLRVMIGDAAGQNFWCVLFPPMCLGVASVPKDEAENALISVGLTPNQYSIITETQNTKYKLRFRILEFFEELW
ncbi:MAG: stage II sporulation protein R [Clostridia bacterium]|nr:stage II sporulation protein R [Clostridia bacterium]